MSKNPQTFVDQYQAHFTVNHVQTSMKSESLSDLQTQIKKQLPGTMTLDASQGERAQVILHNNDDIGSIGVCPVPNWATVQAKEQRNRLARREAQAA